MPLVEKSIPTDVAPAKVLAPKLITQLLPICGTLERSAWKTMLAAPCADMPSAFVNSCPSEPSVENEPNGTKVVPGAVGALMLEIRSTSTGTNGALPLSGSTLVEPYWPFMNIVPNAAASTPAPEVGSRFE